ncbi:MAG: CDP-alcohol phosphatidyltransferase family protein [Rhodothermales bacterium]|nr:CDP-alcohol phosphatidyltransferase family protein [Rhodothermales bacterium]MBO6778461.1 CDP-alcohol phosphatidyltransferase family protein [Rhodothermales bacterium]
MTDAPPPSETPSGWPDLGDLWTVPNVLSMVRLVLVLPLAYLIMADGRLLWIMVLTLLIVATDYFDGRIARWSKTVSEWGKVLDPLADKLAGGLVVMALVVRGALPAWLLAVVAARDLAILAGGAVITKRDGVVLSSMFSGKIAVTALAITVLAALLRADPEVMQVCIWGTTALLVWSFIRYMIRFVKVYRHGTEAIAARS